MDYEKAYKEALERARNLYNEINNTCLVQHQIKGEAALQIFPELKESEDEQHRKWILEYLYDGLRKSDEQFKDQFKYAIAWLEKQGEKHIDGKLSNLLNRVICRFINDPYIPYSERDEVSNKIIPYVEQLEKQGEKKPAWSEEDEKMLKEIVSVLEGNNVFTTKMLCEYANWLKSLKPQPRWKPTDEQIRALSMAYKDSLTSGENLITQTETLKSLYNDLKALNYENK